MSVDGQGSMSGGSTPRTYPGLLDQITAHSLDQDYAYVSRSRSGSGPESRGKRSAPSRKRPALTAFLILALFGLLVVTAAVQTSRNAVAAQDSRKELIDQIRSRSADVEAKRERILDIRRDVQSLETRFFVSTTEGRAVSDRLDRLGTTTGSLPVEGPGVVVVVDDAPDATSAKQEVLDKDLQKLVNALWESGAEAISINGQRLTNLSAIRHAGAAITVNYRSLARPYVVSAIGDQNSIPARFVETEHGAEWLDLQAAFGLQFDMTSKEFLTLPAASRLDLRHARSAEKLR